MTTRIRGKEFYIVQELLDILPVGEVSITGYLRSGRLKGIKIGRIWYVPRIELDRFLDPRYQEDIKRGKEDIQS
ncbi:unnamed protein product [marine sediment metagenome]|uniref:Helix-turn-helix domain-containing protein n=1 Tax=marine sediment metagenome TaxID=412755 RepID=X1REV0_9ZZZZ